MPNYDYFKQYTSEQNRIREKIQAEENPYHREHIVFFNEMVEDKNPYHPSNGWYAQRLKA